MTDALRRSSKNLANAETEVILEENFDLTVDGSPDDIDTSFDLSGYVTDFDEIEYYDNLQVTDFKLPDGWNIELNDQHPEVGTNPAGRLL
ncbi:MAG: hypothetical protein LIP03_11645 [Bacteroidales bacterium]|nr:hypothetical protein [Bacteroidales bacterium]